MNLLKIFTIASVFSISANASSEQGCMRVQSNNTHTVECYGPETRECYKISEGHDVFGRKSYSVECSNADGTYTHIAGPDLTTNEANEILRKIQEAGK